MPEILDRAFRLAESGRPGPVLISVPMDVFQRRLKKIYLKELIETVMKLLSRP